MPDDPNQPSIKVTDRRHFDKTGERRREDPAPAPAAEPSAERTAGSAGGSSSGSDESARNAAGRAGAPSGDPGIGGGVAGSSSKGTGDAGAGRGAGVPEGAAAGRAGVDDLSRLAAGLTSSFSLLVARLAQETEIYLGLVPYPGGDAPETDLEAARAMIDMLSMLQEKTRGNLDDQEARLLEDLLYTYRLEFVRRRSGGGER